MSAHPHHTIPPLVPPANCFTVLVVDDMLPNRLLLGKFLRHAGYAVIEASNGIEALDLLLKEQAHPDLIVTDVEMPVMDGVAFVEQVRCLDNGFETLPIITASGNPTEEMSREAHLAGTTLFLTKPFDLKALGKSIAKLLRESRRSSISSTDETATPSNRLGSTIDSEVQL
ncbi:MAG: response regulator [Verrucomicrobiota bacterium]